MKFIVGIDVGGSKKGFHCAAINFETNIVIDLRRIQGVESVVPWIQSIDGECMTIAIDCPPKANRQSKTTRLAERELHQAEYRLQWTREVGKTPDEWMVNGENLWRSLKIAGLKVVSLIETFPTAASDRLFDSPTLIPLKFFAGKEKRKQYKDFVDACICAEVARKNVLKETKTAGGPNLMNEVDELGPIHY